MNVLIANFKKRSTGSEGLLKVICPFFRSVLSWGVGASGRTRSDAGRQLALLDPPAVTPAPPARHGLEPQCHLTGHGLGPHHLSTI